MRVTFRQNTLLAILLSLPTFAGMPCLLAKPAAPAAAVPGAITPAEKDRFILSTQESYRRLGEITRLFWSPDESSAVAFRKGGRARLLNFADGTVQDIPNVLNSAEATTPLPGVLVAWDKSGEWKSFELASRRARPATPAEILEATSAYNTNSRAGTRGHDNVPLLIINRLTKPVKIDWMESAKKRVNYATVAPGRSIGIPTFSGHRWRAFDAADRPVATFDTPALGGVFVVEEKPAAPADSAKNAPRKPAAARALSTDEKSIRVNKADGTSVTLAPKLGATEKIMDSRLSPDVRHLACLICESVAKRQLTYTEKKPPGSDKPRSFTIDYNKPGDPVDRFRISIMEVDTGSETLAPEETFRDAWPFCVNAVGWAADSSEFYSFHAHRSQKFTRLTGVTPQGVVRTVAEYRSETFVDSIWKMKTPVRLLKNGTQALWATERDGRQHLYRIDLKTGAFLNCVTPGEVILRDIVELDETAGTVETQVLALNPGENPYHVHHVRYSLDGSKPAIVLTHNDGTHKVSRSPSGRYLIDIRSRVDLPPRTSVVEASTGRVIFAETCFDQANPLAGDLVAKRFTAKGRDGKTDIHGVLYLPLGKRELGSTPVIENIYAGPHGAFTRIQWEKPATPGLLAEGYAVVMIDGMGTNWREKSFHDVCYKNIRDAGFPDRILWIKALAKKYPSLDLNRVGIIGGSAGGQSAAGALIFHNDFYKAAVADCGCHDNRIDKLIWNESWFGWPVDESYAENSNIVHAGKLKGDLLLLVGELDTNVDTACTFEFAKALTKAGKTFTLYEEPGGGHCVSGKPIPAAMILEFFRKSFAPKAADPSPTR